ncbi:MAG: glycosyltransferase family A protein [bacterium]
MGTSRPEASIITTHKGPPGIIDVLRLSLEEQSFPFKHFEWVVVDDGSEEGVPEWFQTYEGPLTIVPIQNIRTLGRSTSRNRAVQAARGKILVFLDSDMTVVQNWLACLVESVEKSGAVVLGKVNPHYTLPRTKFVQYIHSRGAQKLKDRERCPGRYFSTNNSAMPAEILRRFRGFDETFIGWGGEDLEMGLRLERGGIKFSTDFRAKAFHRHHREWHVIEKQYMEYGRHGVPYIYDLYGDHENILGLDKLQSPLETRSLGGAISRLMVRMFNHQWAYKIARSFVVRWPEGPWPDRLFDFLLFYLYSRGLVERKKGTVQ